MWCSWEIASDRYNHTFVFAWLGYSCFFFLLSVVGLLAAAPNPRIREQRPLGYSNDWPVCTCNGFFFPSFFLCLFFSTLSCGILQSCGRVLGFYSGFRRCHCTIVCLGFVIMSCQCFVSLAPLPFLPEKQRVFKMLASHVLFQKKFLLCST